MPDLCHVLPVRDARIEKLANVQLERKTSFWPFSLCNAASVACPPAFAFGGFSGLYGLLFRLVPNLFFASAVFNSFRGGENRHGKSKYTQPCPEMEWRRESGPKSGRYEASNEAVNHAIRESSVLPPWLGSGAAASKPINQAPAIKLQRPDVKNSPSIKTCAFRLLDVIKHGVAACSYGGSSLCSTTLYSLTT